MTNNVFGEIKSKDLTFERILLLQSYVDSVFRLIIFIYTLDIAVLIATKGHIFVWIISTLMVVLSIAYALWITFSLEKLMSDYPGYSMVNIWFYYAQVVLMVALYFAMFYYYYSHKLG